MEYKDTELDKNSSPDEGCKLTLDLKLISIT